MRSSKRVVEYRGAFGATVGFYLGRAFASVLLWALLAVVYLVVNILG